MIKQIINSILLLFIFTSNLFSQGGNTTATASGSPITLPFSSTGSTVSSAGHTVTNDISNIELQNLGFTSGNDWFYYFCATTATEITYTLTYTPDPVNGVWPSFSVYQGMPSNATLLTYNLDDAYTNSSMTGSFVVGAGLCYYIMIDNWAPPAGFSYTLNLTLPPAFPVTTLQPSCTNMGYELNNFTGWSGSWSNDVVQSNAGSLTPVYIPQTFNTTTAQHAITSAGTDVISGLPLVSPGFGIHSARIGDLTNGKGGSTLEQKYTVSASNALFTYSYAVVIENALGTTPLKSILHPLLDSINAAGNAYVILQNYNNTGDSITSHIPEQQPFFKIDLYDCTGVPIACGQYLVTGGPNVPGFTKVTGTEYYYKNWTNVFIDLTPYIGTCVSIKYTTADCALGGHMCYAYVDASCGPIEITGPVNICPGGSGTLVAPDGGASYSWTINGVPAVILGTSKTLVVSPVTASTTYKCVIISVTGCSTTLSFTVNLYTAPTVTSTSDIVCAGGSATLTATGLVAGGTYSWSPTGTSSSTLTQSPAATTTYTVTYTDINLCTATGTGVITVIAGSAITAGSNSPICIGTSLNLTSTFVPGGIYSWTGPNGFTSTIQNPSISAASASASGEYMVTITVAGCSATGTVNVTINPAPITVASANTPICEGVNLNLAASAATGSTYSWTGPNGFISAVQNPIITAATVSSSGSYTVTVSTAGCSSTSSVLVAVIPAPVATAGSNSPICAGTPLNLTATAVSGATYSWTGPNGFTSAIQNPSISAATAAASGAYTVTLSVSGCSVTSVVSATVNPGPITVASANTPICEGVNLNLAASTAAGATYSWTGPNGFISALQNPIITAATASSSGSYTVTVASTGCSSTSSVEVVVSPIPLTVAGAVPICSGSTLNLTSTASAGSTYSWTGPNGFSSTLQNPSIPAATITAAGVYTVTVTASSCASSSTVNAVINVPVLPIFPPVASICEGAIAPVLMTTSSNGYTGSWLPFPVSTSITGPSTYNFTPNSGQCVLPTSAVITINALPVITAAVSPICLGSDLNLTSTSSAGSTYSWTGPNGFSSTLQNPTIAAATLAASGLYTVTVTANTCFSSSTVNAVVSAFVLPLFPTGATVCEGTIAPVLMTTSFNGFTGSWLPSAVSTTILGPTTYNFTPTSGQCALPTSAVITINPKPIIVTSPRDICSPLTVDLTDPLVTTGSTAGVVLSYWQDPACTISLSPPSAVGVSGTYFIKADLAGCSGVASVAVVIHSVPLASFTPTPSIVSNLSPNSTMINTSIGAVSYSWDFGDNETSNLNNPSHYFSDSDTGTYVITLTATNSFGCIDIAVATVKVIEELIFYVPNTFTPDKDSYNESFQPIFTSGIDPLDYKLLIFDRWGEVIFESHNTDIGWRGFYGADGVQVQDDTYTWKIEFTVKSTNQKKTILGHVNVLR
jgi:gliding motility-associated-like protein